MNFLSDNTAAPHPRVVETVAATANFAPHRLGYGHDEECEQMTREMCRAFETDKLAVFLMSTGTAANALGLAHLCPPGFGIVCHEQAHIVTEEAGATIMFTGGGVFVPIDGSADGKITCTKLDSTLHSFQRSDHSVVPVVVSITNLTEKGVAYSPRETMAICQVAKAHKLKVHVDGARLFNAVAHHNCSLADLTWRAGVDVLSLGFTKIGGMNADCVVLFNPTSQDIADFTRRQKRGGQLSSKSRFGACQVLALLKDHLALDLAFYSNEKATYLAEELRKKGVSSAYPVQGNEVFIEVSENMAKRLQEAGAQFYSIRTGSNRVEIRLVTSYLTTKKDVDEFCATIRV